MITNNPEQLKDEVLRRLGAPIIKVEVTQEQIDDCIQRSLELFAEYHYNGTNKTYIVLITGEDNPRNVFDLSNHHVFAITKVLRTNMGSLVSMDGTAVYPWFTDFLMGLTGGSMGGCRSGAYGMNAYGADLGYFSQMMSYQKTMQDLLAPLPDYNYNDDTGQFSMFGQLRSGDVVVLEAMVRSFVDVPSMSGNVAGYATAGTYDAAIGNIADNYDNPYNSVQGGVRAGQGQSVNKGTSAYNNRWVKDYTTALVKEVNGQVLGKFQGMMLPGGVSPDGVRLIQEAKEEQRILREELLLLTASNPVMMI
ncbi:neck protein [Pectobacterium phage POP12]|nr:neck protein [Pectobacterium phage POP12]